MYQVIVQDNRDFRLKLIFMLFILKVVKLILKIII
jgi:hypothetical protein